MNDLQEIIQAIYIGIVVATFLYMTGRARKAIELCKESLVLLGLFGINLQYEYKTINKTTNYKNNDLKLLIIIIITTM